MAHSSNKNPGGWRKNVSDGAKRSADSRKCPKCNRKSALKHYGDSQVSFSYCRYCDYGKRELKV
jgi:Zn ribbon nucleic-acid-binding protein